MNNWSETNYGMTAATATVDLRVDFIRKTYAHRTAAIGVFVLLSYLFLEGGLGERFAQIVMGGGQYAWLLVLGGFMIAGYFATWMAQSSRSIGTQYLGLFVYTLAWAILFSPVIFIATTLPQYPGVLSQAAILTLSTFGGLTFYVFATKKDFSFLGPILAIVGIGAIALIVGGVLFGFHLGLWFSVAMIVFAAGAVLYSTSKVLHQFGTDQYVAAALELFAAIAMMFWYVLRLLMARR